MSEMSTSPALIAEHRLIRKLRNAGATSAAGASSLEDLRWLEQRRLERLRSRAIVREPQPGRFYLDEAAYAELRAHRLRLLLGLAALIAAVYAVLALLRVAF